MNTSPAQLSRLARQWQRGGEENRLDRAFARIANSELRYGNALRLLRDAGENYPAWLEAIRSAQTTIHFENFIIADDETGRAFAEALIERAQAGVRVRVLYDWLGSSGRALHHFWSRLRRGGVDVRAFNQERDPDVGAPLVEVLAAEAGRDHVDRSDVPKRGLGLLERLLCGVIRGLLGASNQLDDLYDGQALLLI